MKNSNATGDPLVSNGLLGGDIIHLKAGDSFVPHTHPGDHLLIVVGGLGTVVYNGKIYPTQTGQIYMIEGKIPHAVGAITNHVILAVGCPHRPIDSVDRMKPVEYKAVTTNIESLHCLICGVTAKFPLIIHEKGCQHCPCFDCHPYE
ncbi:MAG: cupin domain-containing protein [Candidatus Kariarchaeaceae archaeon]|jgi:quercetin dioxygenase-like cupin family protein